MERRAAASTVNLALASLDALYRCLGRGRPTVRREKPAHAAPRALDEDGQRRVLRAAEAAPVRALVMLMLFTALRISETVAIDIDDVRITARKGVLVVTGKGELRREVPLNALVRQVLDEWLEHRTTLARDGERALWVSRTGGRLSARSADRDVRGVAAAAGLELSAHTLRHTCLTALVRKGNDLVMVAELAGPCRKSSAGGARRQCFGEALAHHAAMRHKAPRPDPQDVRLARRRLAVLTGPRSSVHPGESDGLFSLLTVDAPGGGGEPRGRLRPALRRAVLPRRRPAAAVRRPARRRTALTAAGGHRVNVRCVTPLDVETASIA
jgi:integrase